MGLHLISDKIDILIACAFENAHFSDSTHSLIHSTVSLRHYSNVSACHLDSNVLPKAGVKMSRLLL